MRETACEAFEHGERWEGDEELEKGRRERGADQSWDAESDLHRASDSTVRGVP